METAYNNKNYLEAYQYATSLLEISDPITGSVAWIYKGLSAGMLSTPESCRLEEMQGYIQNALGLDPSILERLPLDAAAEAAYAVYSFTWDLLSELSGRQSRARDYAGSGVRPTVVVSTKSMAETAGYNIGAGIGAGLARSVIENKEVRRIAVSQGTYFKNTYESRVIKGLEFAWSIGTSEKVAKFIFETAKTIAGTAAINPVARQNALKGLSPLLTNIIQRYPTYQRPQVLEPGYVWCPNCGYSAISKVHGWSVEGCFQWVLIFLTGGLIILVWFLRDPGPENIKVGDKVSCDTCNYEWVYRG